MVGRILTKFGKCICEYLLQIPYSHCHDTNVKNVFMMPKHTCCNTFLHVCKLDSNEYVSSTPQSIFVDFGARSKYLRQGYVITSHSLLWDVMTYPVCDICFYRQSPRIYKFCSMVASFKWSPSMNGLWKTTFSGSHLFTPQNPFN